MNRVRPILAILGAGVIVIDAWLVLSGLKITRPLRPDAIHHEAGHAYVSHVRLRWPLRALSDDGDHPRQSRAMVLQNGVALGPGHSTHDTIRQVGGGRFSHWHGSLYFSTPDNSDPRSNGHRYEIRHVAILEQRTATVLFLVVVALLAAGRPRLTSRWVTSGLARRVRRLATAVLVRSLLVAGAIALVLGSAEALWRWRKPFARPSWPSIFDERLGFRFQPGSTVRTTNGVDFWMETRVNSLGFLDREPRPSPVAEDCRVLVLGDSYVEAAQVPIDRKFHVVFEQLANERLPRPVRTVALGFSGTGQANQLPFYEVLGRDFKPDVVILVFVENDFANNSPLLEAVRNGWHPLRSPRLFLRRDAGPGRVSRVPIDADWRAHLLSTDSTEVTAEGWIDAARARISEASFLYRWAFTHLSVTNPALAAKLTGKPDLSGILASRMTAIRNIPGFEHAFDGWHYPNDLDYDTMFYATTLPPVFQEAVELTGFVIDEYLRHARDDGFSLVVLASDRVRRQDGDSKRFGRILNGENYYRRLASLLESRRVPLIDVHEYILRQGGRLADAHFHRDGHWSMQGHRWAAAVLMEFFTSHPELCPEGLAPG